jgi:hypothetical protein
VFREIVWKLGAPPLSGQHAPTPLPNGNILIFDNGPHRLDESFPFSRVIEVNPRTNDIVWKYQEGVPSNFFSPRISNAERLPNGNTLINDGWFGRFFEVTSTGDVVWEYVNPYFGPASKTAKAQNNMCFAYTAIPIKRSPDRGRQYEEEDTLECVAVLADARLPQRKTAQASPRFHSSNQLHISFGPRHRLCADDGQPFHNPVSSGLPTTRVLSIFLALNHGKQTVMLSCQRWGQRTLLNIRRCPGWTDWKS